MIRRALLALVWAAFSTWLLASQIDAWMQRNEPERLPVIEAMPFFDEHGRTLPLL